MSIITHYEPTLASLRSHAVPDWFHDAKLGIFIHWGLYSVPAWAPLSGELGDVLRRHGWAYWFAHNPYAEWYMNSMRIAGSPTQAHHAATYGAGFPYSDFAPLFNEAAARMDPQAWAELFARAGAGYVVMVAKHHDGFTLWPSQHPNPYKPDYHARRDLVGEVAEAVRARGMRMGLYYSGGLDWTFNPLVIRDLADMLLAVPQSREYIAYADAHLRELMERYKPSVLWNDIGYPGGADLKQLFADYYNAVPDGVINDRFTPWKSPPGAIGRALFKAAVRLVMMRTDKRGGEMPGGPHFDFRTPEYRAYDHILPHKWESTRGLGYSFGYNQQEGPEHVLSLEALVRQFVDIVSKNGNLLLNVGPMADGTIPDLQRERLLGLGEWLAVNGEAIYGTRPWRRAEGRTGDGVALRFTQKDDALYVFLLDAPKGEEVALEWLTAAPSTSIQLLGRDGALSWRQNGRALCVRWPQGVPAASAYTLRIVPQPRWVGAQDDKRRTR